jgi:4-hydroxy-3-methylbut-2-enyl diphosphate reductase
MEVIVAKTAGFCFGVERAVNKVYEQIEKTSQPIYTYGPIIHNEEVVKDLEAKGVKLIADRKELEALTEGEGVIIIRSHGVSREVYEIAEKKGLTIVDATCPFVKKIHRLVERECAAGNQVVIIGNEQHPEVEGIKGWGDAHTVVIQTPEEVEDFVPKAGAKLSIVSQTTFNYNNFKELVEKFFKKGYDILVLNTICNATQERQVEAKEIASKVDAMIVIGGKNSSNTQKLYEICLKECKHTYYIQTLGDFDPESVNSVRNVGITAGASTPKNIIEEVHANVRAKF